MAAVVQDGIAAASLVQVLRAPNEEAVREARALYYRTLTGECQGFVASEMGGLEECRTYLNGRAKALPRSTAGELIRHASEVAARANERGGS